MTCFLYQLLTYFYLKHIFSWPLYIFVTYLSEKYISYITVFSKFLHVGYYLVILPNAILNIALKKLVSLISVKYPLGFFYFTYPSLEFKGVFFWTLFVWRPSFYLSVRLQTFSFLTSSPEQSVILTKFGNLSLKSFKVCSNDGPILKGDPVIKLKKNKLTTRSNSNY